METQKITKIANSTEIATKLFALRHIQELKVVAIGDSGIFGVGDHDGKKIAEGPGWGGRFAHDVKAGRYINLSKNGSRARDLLKSQLPGALAMKPDIVLICVGTNDVLRGDFSPEEIRYSLQKLVSDFNNIGAAVVFLGLPDPIKTAVGPMRVKKVLSRRMNIVNTVIKSVCESESAVLLETWDSPNAYIKTMWHVDHMHPSPMGHQSLADQARRSIFLPRRSRTKIPFIFESKKNTELIWLLTNGSKWFIKRSFDLLPTIIYILAIDAIARRKAQY